MQPASNTAAPSDPVAALWKCYDDIYAAAGARLKSHGDEPEFQRSEQRRADAVRMTLSFTAPTTLEGVIAALRAAREFAIEAEDAACEGEEDLAELEACKRCIDGAIAFLAAMETAERQATAKPTTPTQG